MKKGIKSRSFDVVSYFLLTSILVAGFVVYQKYRYDPGAQFLIVVSGVFAYLGWGLIYHHLRRDMSFKVYLEYLLIASIVLVAAMAVFLR